MTNKIPTLQPGQSGYSHILFNHFVYYNLHKHVWSLKALRLGPRGTNRVSGHASTIHMMGVTPKVSETGRLRVIAEKRKHVHAGLIGKVVEIVQIEEFVITDKTPRLRYNPYKGPLFTGDDGCGIDPDCPTFAEIEHCVLHNGAVYYSDCLYHVDGIDGPFFLCPDDVDDWAADTGHTGWVSRDARRSRHYVDGRFCEYVSAICSNR